MLKIIICDGDRLYCEKLRGLINYIFFDKVDAVVECFEGVNALMNIVEEKGKIDTDIIFMETDFPQNDGIKTAKILRKKNVDAEIVFVTEREDKVYQGYEVRAFAYLLKRQIDVTLEETLERYLNENVLCKHKYLSVKKGKSYERIPMKRIKYLVSEKRKIRIALNDSSEIKEFYMKMDELENELKEAGFLRCHQSYLVKENQIAGIVENTLLLTSDEKIPLSRRYRKNVISRICEKEG